MLKQNLILLEERFPDIVTKLQSSPIESMTICETKRGETNASYSFQGKTEYLHSNYSAEKETKKWLSSIDLSDINVLVIYGIGLGYSFKELKSWLNNSSVRHLVYFEDDLAVLEALLKMPDSYELLAHPRVKITFLDNDDISRSLAFDLFTLFFNNLKEKITPLPHYLAHKSKHFDTFRDGLVKSHIMVHQAQPEYLYFGVKYLINFYSTILSLNSSHIGEKLQNTFPQIPAIICGAGPSLQKNAHVLKTLQNKALIFAPGSSISALDKYGIEPHFGGSADAHPAQYGRMVNHSNYEMPVIYKSRINQHAYHALHGPRIYSYGNTHYPILDQLEQKLNLHKHILDNGLSMQHHLTEWACFLGCNPIIYVGLDLAFTDNLMYAEGVHAESDVNKFSSEQNPLLDDVCVLKKDIYGNPVHTYMKWEFEADHSSHFPQKYPGQTFINATEGGIGIRGIPNKTLSETASKYCQQTYNLKPLIHTKLQQPNRNIIVKDKVIDEIDKLYRGLEETITINEKIKNVIGLIITGLQESPDYPYESNLGNYSYLKNELQDHPVYQSFIYPINFIRSKTFQRQILEIESDLSIETDPERFLKICQVHMNQVDCDILASRAHLSTINHSIEESCKNGYCDTKEFLGKLTKFKEKV
ncbi:MAG: hypothetical protein ACI9S8_002218 [Chlamydiales bacterium]|jgi:hypothetical protein